jgi:hypothetical protein
MVKLLFGANEGGSMGQFKLFLILAVILGSLLLVACGDDDDDKDNGGTSQSFKTLVNRYNNPETTDFRFEINNGDTDRTPGGRYGYSFDIDRVGSFDIAGPYDFNYQFTLTSADTTDYYANFYFDSYSDYYYGEYSYGYIYSNDDLRGMSIPFQFRFTYTDSNGDSHAKTYSGSFKVCYEMEDWNCEDDGSIFDEGITTSWSLDHSNSFQGGTIWSWSDYSEEDDSLYVDLTTSARSYEFKKDCVEQLGDSDDWSVSIITGNYTFANRFLILSYDGDGYSPSYDRKNGANSIARIFHGFTPPTERHTR